MIYATLNRVGRCPIINTCDMQLNSCLAITDPVSQCILDMQKPDTCRLQLVERVVVVRQPSEYSQMQKSTYKNNHKTEIVSTNLYRNSKYKLVLTISVLLFSLYTHNLFGVGMCKSQIFTFCVFFLYISNACSMHVYWYYQSSYNLQIRLKRNTIKNDVLDELLFVVSLDLLFPSSS